MENRTRPMLWIPLLVVAFLVNCSAQPRITNPNYYNGKYKMRGPPPPPPPRSPSHLQYIKKWEQHRPSRTPPLASNGNNRLPQRSPSLLPMSSMYSPVFVPPPMGPPLTRQTPAPPLLNHWKTTKTSAAIRTIPEQSRPSTTFHSSMPIGNNQQLNRDFDYHLQSNAIPTHSIPIKQVGEKGPIHTIPAPNLSLADKPIVVVEEARTKEAKIQHQYQVTEPGEFSKGPHKNHVPFAAPTNNPFASPALQHEPPEIQEQLGSSDPPLAPNELYQLLNSHFQRQQVFEGYSPQIQQPQQLSFADYQILLGQAQNSLYLSQSRRNENGYVGAVLDGGEGAALSEFPTAFVATDYNLKAEAPPAPAPVPNKEPAGPNNGLGFVQEGYEANESQKPETEEKQAKENDVSAFYTTLPNRQAAETLASLQAAGNVNSNLAKMNQNVRGANQKTALDIYIPDTDKQSAISNEEEPQEELEDNISTGNVPYGHRMRSKRKD